MSEPKRNATRALPAVGLAVLAAAAALCGGAFAAARADQPLLARPVAVRVTPRAPKPKPHPRRPSDRLAWPDRGAITGKFGEWRGGHRHEGIDIPLPRGTKIRAAAPGRVTLRQAESGYGKYTCVAHRTITTCYGHQSRFGVRLGQRVRRHQVIGYVGSTGDTDANHLHFEVRRGTRPWGRPMDPMRLLRHRRTG